MHHKNHQAPDITTDGLASRNTISGSLTSRLFTSLRPLNRKLSFTDVTSATGFFDPPGPFHPPRQASVSSAQSSPKKVPQRPLPELSHGTPFASQTYIPPAGAPGFEGDRDWNKSHFEFDPESKVQRKNVILKGRKDMTTIVLTPSLADLVSWSPLDPESSEPCYHRSDHICPRYLDCRGHGPCCTASISMEFHSTPSMLVVHLTLVVR